MKFVKSLTAMCIMLILLCTMCFSAFAAYNDVAADNENMQAIEFVDRLGIITSTWDGDFKPDQYLTRADAIVAVYKMLYNDNINAADYESAGLDFIGDGEVGDIADSSALKAYLCWAVDNYLITTNVENSLFKPSEPITANELLTLLAKVLCLVEETDEYPDACVEKMSGIETGLEAGDTPVTREQAAVAFTAAIVSAEGSSGELGVYTDEEGNPLDSLAAKVFNMSSIDLVIRATTGKKLGYNVENGVLLSNGADVDLEADLSDYVGYGITITYSDADKSLTYTEDEEILTYSVSSTITATLTPFNLSMTSGNSVSLKEGENEFRFSTSTFLYLNEAPWPVEDSNYDLSTLIASLRGTNKIIVNRPNLIFKCMKAEGDESATTIFATESKPGKVVGINNGIYTIYDYYYAGTDKEYKNYNVLNCKFSTTVKVGDFVSFYEANGTCYVDAGNAVTTALKEVEAGQLPDYLGYSNKFTFADDSTHLEHAFFKAGDVVLVAKNDLTGPKYTFVTDGTKDSYVITWEAFQTNYATLKILEIKPDAAKLLSKIKAENIKTGNIVEFEVKFDNINSTTPIEVGDIVTYTDDYVAPETPDANAPTGPSNIYIKKNSEVTINAYYDETNKRFIDTDTQKEYLINQFFKGTDGTALTNGETATVTLNLDLANTVISYSLFVADAD